MAVSFSPRVTALSMTRTREETRRRQTYQSFGVKGDGTAIRRLLGNEIQPDYRGEGVASDANLEKSGRSFLFFIAELSVDPIVYFLFFFLQGRCSVQLHDICVAEKLVSKKENK